MLRKLMFAALSGLGLLAVAPAADAASIAVSALIPATFVADYHHHYRVLYRARGHGSWVVHANFHSRKAANRDAHRLERRGYQVWVR